MNYKLVIFDSDGTLANTLPWAQTVFNLLAQKHGFKVVPEHEFEMLRNMSHREMLRHLELPLWKMPAVMASMRQMMAQHVDQLRLFPGVPEMLRSLRDNGVRLGIVSSNSEANVRHILGPENAKLINYYDCGASMFGKASKLRAVLRSSKLPPAQTLYVGDELRDLEAARKVKMHFGAVTWGHHRMEQFAPHQPEQVFQAVKDIAEVVRAGTAATAIAM